MKLLDALARRLLLLAILVLPGCATPRQTARKPATAPPIPSYGGPRRVAVSIAEQKLRAFDGGRLVFETHVSTGHEGKHTPTGRFHALDKELIHYSSLYDNAPMPYSVRFHGNYYLHGFSVVPDYPASHGCIGCPCGKVISIPPGNSTSGSESGRGSGSLANGKADPGVARFRHNPAKMGRRRSRYARRSPTPRDAARLRSPAG